MVELEVDSDVEIPDKLDKNSIKNIVKSIFNDFQIPFQHINIIFVSDQYLKILHRDYLDDNTLTDVITFDLTDEGNSLFGEIYVSSERAGEQAGLLGKSWLEELYRYIIHGVLHLCGMNDMKEHDREQMRKKENEYLLKMTEIKKEGS